MNHAKLYSNAVGRVAPAEPKEDNESAQIILTDAHRDWLENQFTKRLLGKLKELKEAYLQLATSVADDKRKCRKVLHKVEQINEILEYVRIINNNNTSTDTK